MNLLRGVGGRKFILGMLIVICTTMLVWFGSIDDGVYSAVIIATFGTYVAGNVTQKAKEKAALAPAVVP